MKDGIIAHLFSLASVYSEVGTKIYGGLAPAGTEDYIIVTRVTEGVSQRNNKGLKGAVKDVWQIDAYSKCDIKAESIKESVRQGMDGFTGYMGLWRVYSCVKIGNRDLPEPMSDSSEKKTFRKLIDFEIVHSEAVENYSTTTTTTT